MEEDPKDETFLSKRDPCKTVKDKKMKMKLVKRLSKISPTYGTRDMTYFRMQNIRPYG